MNRILLTLWPLDQHYHEKELHGNIGCPAWPSGAGQPDVRIYYNLVPAYLEEPKATARLFEA